MTTVSKVFNTDIHTPCQYTHAHTLIHIHTYRDGFIRGGSAPPPKLNFGEWRGAGGKKKEKKKKLIKKFTDIK